ncbi:hypothetical protein [Lederbergia citri]|nr:hypothetical protein [Lederbergia citri]
MAVGWIATLCGTVRGLKTMVLDNFPAAGFLSSFHGQMRQKRG